MSSDRICLRKSIHFLGIVVVFLISCDNTNPGNEKTASSDQDKLFGAITLGLPLGVLAAKYSPALPEDSRDTQRRLFYTPLLQSSVDGMNMTLVPPPNRLLQAGRGQSQFDKVKDYFAQIGRSSAEYPRCLRYTVGLSLNSAWLILMFHEVEYAKDLDRFKQEFASRLDQFNGLTAAASMACEEEHKGFSKKLSYISKQSLLWPIQLNKNRDASDIVSNVVAIGKNIANYLNELSEVASGVPMSNVDSEKAKILVDRGNLKDAQGRTKDAIADYNEAIKLNPKDTFAYNSRGLAKSRLNLYQEALSDYNKAIELDLRFSEAFNNRGILKAKNGYLLESLEDFSKAINVDSGNAKAYNNRGLANQKLGKIEEAITDYKKAIELDPSYSNAKYNLSVAKSKRGS